MNNPQVDTVYKSYIDAYQAAAILKQQNIDADMIVRIEKSPYGGGYVLRSEPVVLETFIPELGTLGAAQSAKNTTPGYGDKW